VDLQMMLNHLPRDPGHLSRFPGEHINICPEEGDERAFLFLFQIPTDAGGLGGLRSDLDGLQGYIVRIGWTNLEALAIALAREVEGSDPWAPAMGASPVASTWSFSTAAMAAARSLWTVRTPAGVGIFRTRYP
jgi:hypothetical protein